MGQVMPPFSQKHTFVVQPASSTLQTQTFSTAPPSQPTVTSATAVAAPKPTPHAALVLPSIFETKEGHLRRAKPVLQFMREYLKSELDVSRLNRMHKHLWTAGLQQPPRTLHNQIEVGREIRITERADMHLLWVQSNMYLKPLPDFLLSYCIREDYVCKDEQLYASALGFLQSYVWLIIYASDHRMAVEKGLLSQAITWEKWSSFVSDLVTHGILSAKVNPRYHFGELRLHRIHWIYSLCSRVRATENDATRGYYHRYDSYSAFLERNLAWLLTAFLYVAIVLTAMQVALATDHLKDNKAFESASWGLAVFSIIAPLAIVCSMFLYTGITVVQNWMFVSRRRGKPTINDEVWNDIALKAEKH